MRIRARASHLLKYEAQQLLDSSADQLPQNYLGLRRVQPRVCALFTSFPIAAHTLEIRKLS
jgi:hypothetical protein